MKKIALFIAISSVFSTYVQASDDFMSKITDFYSTATNGVLNLEAKKIEDGYKLKISPKVYSYKDIFNSNYPIIVAVDEGPLVTKPHFTFAKAGLESNIELFKIFNQEIQNELTKAFKKSPLLRYQAVLSFSNTLTENFFLEPITIEDDEVKFTLSAIEAKSKVDLNSYTGSINIRSKGFKIEPKQEEGIIEVKGLQAHNEISQKPVNSIVLFGKSSLSVDSFQIYTKTPQTLSLNFSFSIASEIKKVNQELLDFSLQTETKTKDINTIALSKGIKESKLKLLLKNLGTKGVLELIDFSQKMQEVQDKLMANANDPAKKEAALAEYMTQMALLNSKLTEIINTTFIRNKSKIFVDMELLGDKKSFLKLDLLYKAKPLQGDINSAIIGLLAQGLSIVDGSFELKIDRELANSAYPMSSLILEMLRTKGFATEKNGIYHLKGELKDGKVIINNKAYTLEELTATLIQ